MPYKLQDPKVVTELHTGDRIAATLRVDYDGEIYNNARLDDVVITAQGKPDYKPARQFHVPQKGEQLPDFKLTNQNGRGIHLEQYKGRVLLVTFVYTRCPLDDYCPRLSRNFAELQKGMEKDRALYEKTHLLSISFDPAFDSPAVLKTYGELYTGKKSTDAFEHWEFAAPAGQDLNALEEYFDVGVTGENASLVHSLSTVIVGKDGKIADWYPGNDWKPADVLARVKELAKA